ncbi:hypothetical protein [Sphingomonas yantingensis]|uniref:Uncharacterized protein n=1 Tax=Sphingomonas yantingensis TaxID=1241761 RepID=A0A7W9AMG6_9SPHN|nr:hypothetical protein [Sphingomonas yantingensis]MBB5697187.1 hypothetical protein [Sphingomonas yantingensis]
MRLLASLTLALAAPAEAQGLYVPPPDTVTMQSQMALMQAQLAQQAMVAQKDVVLDASGNATWDYSAVGFTKAPAVVHLVQAMDTANPITCNYTARSQTSVTIHCWRTSLLGLLTNLYSGSVAGATVTLVARAVP